MTNKEKIFLLKIAAQLVYRCSEYTPPKVKESKVNTEVAKAAIGIEGLVKYLRSTTPK